MTDEHQNRSSGSSSGGSKIFKICVRSPCPKLHEILVANRGVGWALYGMLLHLKLWWNVREKDSKHKKYHPHILTNLFAVFFTILLFLILRLDKRNLIFFALFHFFKIFLFYSPRITFNLWKLWLCYLSWLSWKWAIIHCCALIWARRFQPSALLIGMRRYRLNWRQVNWIV